MSSARDVVGVRNWSRSRERKLNEVVSLQTRIPPTRRTGLRLAIYAPIVEIKALQLELQKFADERDWDQFHSVRNLVLAVIGEAGELAEVLQWVGDDKTGGFLEDGGRQRLSEEIADVFIYLVRLADKAGVDLESAVRDKLLSNSQKYPVDQARGNAKKYTEFNR